MVVSFEDLKASYAKQTLNIHLHILMPSINLYKKLVAIFQMVQPVGVSIDPPLMPIVTASC